jgi:hypothetical protein
MNIRILLTLLLLTNIWFTGLSAATLSPSSQQNSVIDNIHTELAKHDCCEDDPSNDHGQCLSHCYGLASTTLPAPLLYLFDSGVASMQSMVVIQLIHPPIYSLFRPPVS